MKMKRSVCKLVITVPWIMLLDIMPYKVRLCFIKKLSAKNMVIGG